MSMFTQNNNSLPNIRRNSGDFVDVLHEIAWLSCTCLCFQSLLHESFSKNVDFWCYRVLTRNILNICCFLLFSYLCIHVSIHIKLFPFDIVICLKSGNAITLWNSAFMNVILWTFGFWNAFYKEKYI